MFMAFRSIALDVITSYALANCSDALDVKDFLHPFLTSLQAAIPFFWVLKYVSFLVPVLMNPPEWLIARLDSQSRAMFDMRKQISNQIDELLKDPEWSQKVDHEVVYHHLLSPRQKKDKHISSRDSLLQEAMTLLLAGSDTTGNACTIGAFYTLNDPAVHKKLVEELYDAWPNRDSTIEYAVLEKLPYLVNSARTALSDPS